MGTDVCNRIVCRRSLLKLSRYNHLFSFKDQLRVVYNAASGAVLTLDRPTFINLTDPKGGDLQLPAPETETLLAEHGVLVESGLDERNAALDRYRKRRANRKTLRLTIAPTLDCNFACPYCYEYTRPGIMTDAVAEQVVDFAADRLQHSERLSVDWYGGEPLLVPDRVMGITRDLRQLAESTNKSWFFSMVTNGYRLDETMARSLAEAGISDVQITLDGPPEIHDQRRKLRNGAGTFSRILENLKTAVEIFEDVRLRINLDSNNPDQWKPLVALLEEAGIRDRVRMHIASVDTQTEANAGYMNACLDSETFADTWVDWELDAYQTGKGGVLSLPRMTVCVMVSEWAYVIDPDGNLYKCWNHIGDADRMIGHVSEPDLVDPDGRWKRFDPTDWAACRDCDLLPACMGRCPDQLEKTGPEGTCGRWKHCLKEAVILHTLQKLKGGQHDKTG